MNAERPHLFTFRMDAETHAALMARAADEDKPAARFVANAVRRMLNLSWWCDICNERHPDRECRGGGGQ